jgi:hypothetical protein
MNLLKLFDTCATSRGFSQRHGVDYKIEEGTAFFRQSKEPIDWVRNVLAVIPCLVKLDKWRIVPLGAWLVYRRVRFLRHARFKRTCGISQGGWPAVLLALETGKKAITFGCPRYSVGKWPLCALHYETPNDVVCKLPPWAGKTGYTVVLRGEVAKPHDMSDIEWSSGHSLAEYRQRIG